MKNQLLVFISTLFTLYVNAQTYTIGTQTISYTDPARSNRAVSVAAAMLAGVKPTDDHIQVAIHAEIRPSPSGVLSRRRTEQSMRLAEESRR